MCQHGPMPSSSIASSNRMLCPKAAQHLGGVARAEPAGVEDASISCKKALARSLTLVMWSDPAKLAVTANGVQVCG